MKHDSVFDIKSNFVEEQLEQQEGADVMTLYSKNIHKVPFQGICLRPEGSNTISASFSKKVLQAGLQ